MTGVQTCALPICFPVTISKFADSEFSLDLLTFESSSIVNSPNLSILPLLAYHKICNDHYRNEKWQPLNLGLVT